MADARLVLYIPSERVLGPFRSDESPASIRKHYGVNLDDLRGLLAAQGLHVVSAADKVRLDALTFTTVQGVTFSHCTMAERAVLDAAYAVPDAALHTPITHAEKLYPLCDAIQRWREAQHG